MPCACKTQPPDYPETDHWGPILWTILHAFAERGGKPSSPLYAPDEIRQWILVISTLPKIIPCPSCREHCEEWIITHPINAIKTLPQEKLYGWLTDYVYTFHEAVNARIGKPSFDRSLLASTYGNIRMTGALRALTPYIEAAIELSGLTLIPWKKWVGYARMLMSVYGL